MTHNNGRPPDPEIGSLAEQLGMTRRQVSRIGKYEAQRLLRMDASSRALVVSSTERNRYRRIGIGLLDPGERFK